MSFYLDTSLLVSALVRDSNTTRASEWFAEHECDALFVSDWTITEVSSALAFRMRQGALSEEERALALGLLKRRTADSLATVPVSRDAFRTAAAYLDQHRLGLRPADALHLAVAQEHGFPLCTFDRKQAEVGATLGVATLLA